MNLSLALYNRVIISELNPGKKYPEAYVSLVSLFKCSKMSPISFHIKVEMGIELSLDGKLDLDHKLRFIFCSSPSVQDLECSTTFVTGCFDFCVSK